MSIELEEVKSLTSYLKALSLIVFHQSEAGFRDIARRGNLICLPLRCQLQPRKAAFKSRSYAAVNFSLALNASMQSNMQSTMQDYHLCTRVKSFLHMVECVGIRMDCSGDATEIHRIYRDV